MRAVDTNVLVRLIIRDDARQVAAAESFLAEGAWASVLSLAETCWVLATVYDLNASELAAAIEMLSNNQALVLDEAEAVAAALELFRAKPALGFSDCLILELARKANHLPLGTFDRNLAKVDGVQRL
jgi:predicted nucleic-acid-binding protein